MLGNRCYVDIEGGNSQISFHPSSRLERPYFQVIISRLPAIEESVTKSKQSIVIPIPAVEQAEKT